MSTETKSSTPITMSAEHEADIRMKPASPTGYNVTVLLAELDATRVAHAETQERLADALRTDWQPIETAPKDGTVVLTTDGKDTLTGWWQDDIWWTGWVSGGNRTDVEYLYPTHWMPLPQPPAGEVYSAPITKLREGTDE